MSGPAWMGPPAADGSVSITKAQFPRFVFSVARRLSLRLNVGRAALAREESRGTHFRTDFPESIDAWRCSLRLKKRGDGLAMEKVERGVQ